MVISCWVVPVVWSLLSAVSKVLPLFSFLSVSCKHVKSEKELERERDSHSLVASSPISSYGVARLCARLRDREQQYEYHHQQQQ